MNYITFVSCYWARRTSVLTRQCGFMHFHLYKNLFFFFRWQMMNFFWASNGTTKEEKNSSACRSPGWRLWLVHCAFHLPCLWVDIWCNQVLWCVLRRNTPLLCNHSDCKLVDHIHLCGNSTFWGYVQISISTSRGLPPLTLSVTFAFKCLTVDIH